MAVHIIDPEAKPYIFLYDGDTYFIKVRFATSLEVLYDPPLAPRTELNFFETSPEYVLTPTLDNPYIQTIDDYFWESIKENERTLYSITCWRNTENDEWQIVAEPEVFLINHPPVANAGPAQRVVLEPDGTLANDVYLDASGSSDLDQSAAQDPDPGPLNYEWMLEDHPPGATPDGTIITAANNISLSADPLFLPAGTQVLPEEMGTYSLKLEVTDNDLIGYGIHSQRYGTDHNFIDITFSRQQFNFEIIYPTESNRIFVYRNNEVRIQYSISDVIANNEEFEGLWTIRCRIKIAEVSPLTNVGAVGEVVFDIQEVSYEQYGEIIWNGTRSDGSNVDGLFDLELELLDKNGNSTGNPDNKIVQAKAIIIDPFDYKLPLACPINQIVVTGVFMEAAHGNPPNTHLHGGIDLRDQTSTPDVIAMKSGYYQRQFDNTNTMEIEHGNSYNSFRTQYLHCTNLPNISQGQLILQGTKLGVQGAAGTGVAHLHIQHRIDTAKMNPYFIMNTLLDSTKPVISGIFLRRGVTPGADLNNAATGINGFADFIIYCHDPRTGGQNSIYSLWIFDNFADYSFEFNELLITDTEAKFYTAQSFGNNNTQYLPYLRVDTGPYGTNDSPLLIEVTVRDAQGNQEFKQIVIGPTCTLDDIPMSAPAAAGSFNIQLTIKNELQNIHVSPDNLQLVTDRFHFALLNAPTNWTISPGVLNMAAGAEMSFNLTVSTNGNTPGGRPSFDLHVFSDILNRVGTVIPCSIQFT